MKKIIVAAAAIMLSAAAALAGASSENRLDEKSLEGPDGEGAHSTDPNIERSGTEGPTGPIGEERPGAGSNYNDYSGGANQPAFDSDDDDFEGDESNEATPEPGSSGSSSGSTIDPER